MGGSSAEAVTLDTVADESWNKMAYGVTRSPARLCDRAGKLCYYGRLDYDFHDFAVFVPCFLLFLSSPSLSRYVHLLRVPSSVQQSSATLSKYVVRVLSSCVICTLPRPGIPFVCLVFFVVLISRLAFLLCSRDRYVST